MSTPTPAREAAISPSLPGASVRAPALVWLLAGLWVVVAGVALAAAVWRPEWILGLPLPAWVALGTLPLAATIWISLGAVAALRRETARLAVSHERYRTLFEHTLAGIYRTAIDGRFLECNPALAQVLGYASAAELMRCNAFDLFYDPSERERFLHRLKGAGQIRNAEFRMRRQDGGEVWIQENVIWREGEDHAADVIEGTLIDVTDRKAAEVQIAYQAYHDHLTGLPNRSLFLDRLSQSIAKAQRTDTGLAVLMLDLDRFKVINDTLGHSAGDRLLCGVAGRLRAMVRQGDTVARLSGDEFALLLQYNARAAEGARVAQKVLDRLAEPFHLDDHRLHLTAAIGISLHPSDGEDAEALLRSAYLALYRARELGGGYQLCTPAMNARAVARLALESDLRQALERSELEVLYQPVVSFASGQTVGMEALVRWRHPERGLVAPAHFIPLAEELRLVIPLGEWVLATACRQARSWQDGLLPGMRIAVNLSVRHFQDSDLPRAVGSLLREIGLAPHFLELEITESAAMQDIEQTVATLAALRRLGVRISMDDFGTGQASLGYLKRLPIDSLKIDRDFVRDIDSDRTGKAIVTAIIDMAHGLGLKVIAEGVETACQLDFLSGQGCDEYQGYLVSKPVAAAEIERQIGQGVLLPRAS
jgi:diguanylate cyclase (GGDEF)-like protein/PAS domain S-box-containing protein